MRSGHARRTVPAMIDRSLNYGRDAIAEFLAQISPKGTVIDLGAGPGTDLLCARETEPDARLVAIESEPTLVELLKNRGIETRQHLRGGGLNA